MLHNFAISIKLQNHSILHILYIMYIKLQHNYKLYEIVNQFMQATISFITKPQCEYQT